MAERPPPSAAAIAIGTAIISGLMGYYIGQAQSIGVFGNPQRSTAAGARRAKDENDAEDPSETEEDDDDDDDEEISPEGLKSFDSSTEECKMVFVVRTDLGMTKGEQ
jgi:PTH2 family peptidyl-tRNA hydrolase